MPDKNHVDRLRGFNIKKRKEVNESTVPVISLDFEMSSNISLALESGEMDPFIFPYFDSSGAVYIEHRTDGGADLGFLGADGKALMNFKLPSREDVLFFAKGFATAAEQVSSSPNHDASAVIRTDVANFHVSDRPVDDDPRRATQEQMDAFVAKISSNVYGTLYNHKEQN